MTHIGALGEKVGRHRSEALFTGWVLCRAAREGEPDRNQRDAVLLDQPGFDALRALDFLHVQSEELERDFTASDRAELSDDIVDSR